MTGLCEELGASTVLLVAVRSSAAGATMDVGTLRSLNDEDLVGESPLSFSVPTVGSQPIGNLQPADGAVLQNFTQGTFRTAGRTISLQLALTANAASDNCEVHGTAIPVT